MRRMAGPPKFVVQAKSPTLNSECMKLDEELAHYFLLSWTSYHLCAMIRAEFSGVE